MKLLLEITHDLMTWAVTVVVFITMMVIAGLILRVVVELVGL